MIIYAVMNVWGAVRALCQVHALKATVTDPKLRIAGQLVWRSYVCEECP